MFVAKRVIEDRLEERVLRLINNEANINSISASVSKSEFTFFYGCIRRYSEALSQAKDLLNSIDNFETYRKLIQGKDLIPEDLIDLFDKLQVRTEFNEEILALGEIRSQSTQKNPRTKTDESLKNRINFIFKRVFSFFRIVKWSISKASFYFQLRLRRKVVLYYNQQCSLFDHFIIYFKSAGRCIAIRHYSGGWRAKNVYSDTVDLEARYKLYKRIKNSDTLPINSWFPMILSVLLPTSMFEGSRIDQKSLSTSNEIEALLLFEENLVWDLRILGVLDRWLSLGTKLLICNHGNDLTTGLSYGAGTSLEKSLANYYFQSLDFRKTGCERTAGVAIDNRTFLTSKEFKSIHTKVLSYSVRNKVCFFSTDMSHGFLIKSLDYELFKYSRDVYLKQRSALLECLASRFQRAFFVRPHPADGSGLIDACVERGITYSMNSASVDLHSKLCIFNYFSTLFFVALRLGVPAIVVDSRDLAKTDYSSDGLEFIATLQQSDCFFNSVGQLEEFLTRTSMQDFGSKRRRLDRASIYRRFFGSGCSPRDSVLALLRASLAQ